MTSRRDIEKRIINLPNAYPAYPDGLIDRLRYHVWRIITPLHRPARELLIYMRLLRNQGRQNYLLGKLAPGESIESFIEFLLDKGFGNHFVAFDDEGQVASLRYAPDFKHQYHVRVFEDGEVRGHFEYTPEAKPLLHMRAVGQEPRFEDFTKMFGSRLAPAGASNAKEFSWSLSFAGFKTGRKA